jgi:hypothetical protein
MKAIRTAVLIIAFLATTVPIANLLELPSKLALDGPVWLSLQQHLSPVLSGFYGPVEVIALVSCAALFVLTRRDPEHGHAYLIAAACYMSMVLYFFLFNAPVNHVLASWTAATLPANWSQYRLKLETEHVLAAVFSLIAFGTLLQARLREGRESRAETNISP